MGKKDDLPRFDLDDNGEVLVPDFDKIGTRDYDPNYGGPYLDEVQNAQKEAIAEVLNTDENVVLEGTRQEEVVVEVDTEVSLADELLVDPTDTSEDAVSADDTSADVASDTEVTE